jgi:hypothetical protein
MKCVKWDVFYLFTHRNPAMRVLPSSFSPLHSRVGLAVLVALACASNPVFAASFSLSSNSITAQTLGSGSGQTGTVAAGTSLTVSGSTVAVTVTGNNATLTNLGTISQTGSGRVIRDNTGVSNLVVNNGSSTNSTALMQSADADVFQMNKATASVTLNNYGSMISLNASASGAQVVDFAAITSGSNVVNNYAAALMKAYEADAVRPGVSGVVNNWGTIQSITTTGSSSDGVDAQTNSGITINNYASGLIDGARHGITGGAADSSTSFTMLVNNSAGGIIRGNNGSGLNLDGFNAKQVVTITNGGLIVGNGVTGDGDGVDVDGVVYLINTGTIRSLNAYSPVASGLAYSEGISVGGGTITNSGTIEGLVASGNTNALGRGISLVGNDITTGALAGTREGLYANAIVTNQAGGLIRGQNDSAIVAYGAASGFTVTINNAAGGSIQGGSSTAAAIVTGADNASVYNSGLIDGASSGKAIEMGSGNNHVEITGGSASVLGDINGGVGGSNSMLLSPGAGNTFIYAGAISNFASVEIQSGAVTLSGLSSYTGSTRISGGVLTLDGANRLSASSALELNGGTLRLANSAGADAQTFASLVLGASSTIDLGGSSLSFSSLGTITSGQTLTVLNFSAASSSYAFRVLGDYRADADFLRLVSATTINGTAGVSVQFDGSFTTVTAVPEPSAPTMLLAGLGMLGMLLRRRLPSLS